MGSKKKYYGVIDGREGKPKIYETWDACKANTIGIKGVRYKGFATRAEAEAYIKDSPIIFVDDGTSIPTDIAIYVDGSYKGTDHSYSYGLVVVSVAGNENIHEECGKGTNEEAADLRNVAGEMKGAMRAVQYAKENGIKAFSLCYDYTGIEAWARGSWKRNNPFTEAYHQYMQKCLNEIEVSFVKIKGHSNNQWNDVADRLAKKALGIEG